MAVCSAAACAFERLRRASRRLVRTRKLPALLLVAIASVALNSSRAWGESQHTSTNFLVRSFDGGPHATDVARHCEDVCRQLREEVFGLEPSARWQPKCMIVLHASRASYAAAVGPGAMQTIGSSTVSLSGGRVTKRRVDLLAVDPARGLAAAPHELVHVLFVDAFPTTPPPKWAEEGLALSFDTEDKRARHRRDLKLAFESHSTLPVARLLADAQYPAAARRAAFYAQSLSLVEYLMQQGPPDEFVRFVKLTTNRGATHALHDVYHLAPAELERKWRLYATSTKLTSLP